MGKFCSPCAAIYFAALAAIPVRAEVVTDLAPFTWDSARPQVLVLEGEITRRAPPLLGLALGRFAAVEVLELSSLVGDAYAAMAMVPTIRAAGLATRITAGDKCHSACAFLYFAGTNRAAEGELGVHKLASANEASGHFIMNDVLDVFSDLGVPDTVRRRMMQTPPDEMYVFSPVELAALGLVGPANPQAVADPAPAVVTVPDPVPPAAPAPTAPSSHIALEIAGEANGRVVVELFTEIAPENAARLATLAREGAYDGVAFHRVIDRFMAQTGDVAFGKAGGDLARAGTGGSAYPDLPAEFSGESFVAGTVGMARSADPDSANAQFFIMFEPAPHLDGGYTVVGQVVEGLEVVQAIKRGGGAAGTVTDAPDRIVRAMALSDPDGPELPGPASDSEVREAGPRVEFHFDFTEQGRVTLNMGWVLSVEKAATVGCVGGETRSLDEGLIECIITTNVSEEVLLVAGPADGISFSAGDDGSRELTLEVRQFLSQLTPTDEEAMEFKDMRFDFIVAARRVADTTGANTTDGTTAQLLLTLQQIVETPETIPGKFTTQFY